MVQMSKVHGDAIPVEDRPEGMLFSVGKEVRGPFRGVVSTGWFVDPPPGVRAKVVEILGNVVAGIRVQGPVLVHRGPLPTHLEVCVDSDVPLETNRPLFLLLFEQDYKPHVNRVS